ncbi:MAG: alanine racemase [Desulfamplus sp.]|nr:alanine racemase [Desulfamplus sp.]
MVDFHEYQQRFHQLQAANPQLQTVSSTPAPQGQHTATAQQQAHHITFHQLQTILNKTTPTLPDNILLDFVESHFRKRRNILHVIGGHLTPCYLFEPNVLIANAKAFKRAFQQYLPESKFYFAMKSNNFIDVSKTVISCGFGLDVSSGAELATALRLGAGDIVFSGPGKSAQELDLAIANNSKVVVLMDSFSEMRRLEKRAARQGRQIRAGVRLTTEPNGLWRKFGILLEDLQLFITESKRYKHILLQGLQSHSSWNMGPERQIAFIKELSKTIAHLKPEDQKLIKFIDIGGGYWPEQGEWLQSGGTPQGVVRSALSAADPAFLAENLAYPHYFNQSSPIEVFALELSRAISEYIHTLISCKICFEPGRWIANECMSIILRVMDKKYGDLVITDGGTNAVGWERFETDYCPILNISRPALTEKECLITGSLCTPHDVWGYSYWGADIKEGDFLMIPSQGAYTYSLRQNFIKSAPEVITFP